MKNSIRFIFSIALLHLFVTNLFSQEKNKVFVKENSFEIVLENLEYRFTDEQKGRFTIRDYYDYTDESNSGSYKLPWREIIAAIPAGSKPNVSVASVKENKISNVIPKLNPAIELINDSTVNTYELDYNQRKHINFTQPLIENKGYLWFRDFYCIHLRINTHQFDESQNLLTEISDIRLKFEFEPSTKLLQHSPLEIKSDFDENLRQLFINWQIAEQFRSNPPKLLTDNTGNWINYSANYLRIGTVSDGIYRITKQDLENYGINTSSINPKTFQLFEYGIEKPIYVSGEADLSFDNGDYIEFYGTINYSKISARVINANNQPYNNYLDKYTDTTIYFLTWGTTNGLRAQEKNIFYPSLTDTVSYYTSFTHQEQNPMDALFYTFHENDVENHFPFWNTGKGWYWRWLATWANNATFTISATDIVPNKTAKFYCKLTSRGSSTSTNVHLIKMLMNDVLIDSQVRSRYQRVLMEGSLSSNSLINGNNTLKINYSDYNGASNGQMLIDWVEAEYPRTLKLTGNSLYFDYRDNLTPALRIFKIENVPTTNYLLFKIKPNFERITALNFIGGNLYFTDTVTNGDAYYLVRQDIASKPIFFKYKTFTNLRSQNNQVDYIAITHPFFLTSVTNYVNFISSNFGVNANIYSVEDIYDEFGYGYPTSDAIRDFIIHRFQNASSPKPSYLVLFGDANYDYKKYRAASQGVVGGGNFVPSYGFPVSDPFYAIWDSSGVRLPQMYVGRIPLNNNSEMDHYKSKVQNNFVKPYDDWNKKYLFFSGGRADYPEEIALYKSVNDSVINNFVAPPSLKGVYKHFYKTTNPLTDFGPYSSETIKNTIQSGGVFISYIGHSGIATWDNSISSVTQLKNTVNRNPVVTDFGCSTNKFAEPDLVAFGERFVLDNDGQAIAYLGNSGIGFVSTAIKAPGNFYKSAIKDSFYQIGKAHLQAKILMFQQLGSSNVVNQFSFANTLIGDPIVIMKIPNKPNLSIKNSDVLFESSIIDDLLDSVKVNLVVNNFGTVSTQTFKANITHYFEADTVQHIDRVLTLPNYKDTLVIWLKTKKLAGQHIINIYLDTENAIDEIYETDNSLSFIFNVASTTIRDLFVINRTENPLLDSLVVLNPIVNPNESLSLIFQIADNENFNNALSYNYALDTFRTKISFTSPPANNRNWLRYRASSESEWSNPLNFSKLAGAKYFLGDSYSWNQQNLSKLRTIGNELQLTVDTITLSIISAGGYSGQYCIITKNGINLLSNTFFQGIGIVVFNEKTLEVESSTYFELFNNPSGVNACTNFINSIPENKLVALGVSGDAKNNLTTALSNAVVSLGGTLFPSIQFKAPYALFGKKNASPSQVKQVLKTPFQGPIQLDTSIAKKLESGVLTSTTIGPSSKWNKLKISQTNFNNSEIKYRPIGVQQNGNVDTLAYLTIISNEADLSFINANTYPYIKIRAEFKSDSLLNSSLLSELEVDYKGIAELGTNYQAVSLNKDTVAQGEKSKLKFFVFNAGETTAKNFNVKVDVFRPDSSHETVLNQFVDSLVVGDKKLFATAFVTDYEFGQRYYKISIDADNQVFEYYKDNNLFTKPFFIKRDSTKPIISLFVDGNEIVDGDLISTNPNFRIELIDHTSSRDYDANSLYIKLDERDITLAKNTGELLLEVNQTNPKIALEYKPTLEPGEHTLKVFTRGSFGNGEDSIGLQKRFIVSNETAISNIYNYPNPASNETYFTFELAPNYPKEVKILIYTLAGRLVKTINVKDFRTNFNKVFWDTRDEDGDLLSSGTYLYKLVMIAGDKTETFVNKLAIVRQ